MKNAKEDAAILAELAQARSNVASSPYTSLGALDVLAIDASEKVRAAVANNQNTSLGALSVLARDANEEVRAAVAKNPNTPSETLAGMTNDESWLVRANVAINPNTTVETLAVLANDANELVRGAIAQNKNTSAKTLAGMTQDEKWRIRELVASNHNISEESLGIMSRDLKLEVRTTVALNPNVSAESLELLSHDPNYTVRALVAINPNTSAKTLAVLANDEYAAVREVVEETKQRNANATAKAEKESLEKFTEPTLDNLYRDPLGQIETGVFVDYLNRRDPTEAFNNAIQNGLKNPDDYMYMHSDKKNDYFKHADTRAYKKFKISEESLKKSPVKFQKNTNADKTVPIAIANSPIIPMQTGKEAADILPAGGFRFPQSEDMKQDVMTRLEAGVKALFETDRYKDYLKTAAKFHDYSASNALLIWMQKPDATHVAGFRAWQDKFERTVKKGEKGIRIITPRVYKDEVKNIKTGEKSTVERLSFGVGVVFDVSQTEGKDLQLSPFDYRQPDGKYEQFDELKAALEKAAGVPVNYVKDLNGADGCYHLLTKEISVLDNLSQESTLSTLIHETAHSRMHADRGELKERKATQRTLEVEAESVAFVTCEHFGIDTGDSSFAYVAGWSKDKTIPELKSSQERIQKESHALIGEIEKHLGIEQVQKLSLTENQTQILKPRAIKSR
jgi:hypothetical protein